MSVSTRAFQRDLIARITEPTHHGRFRVHYKADLDSAHSSEQVSYLQLGIFFIAPPDKVLLDWGVGPPCTGPVLLKDRLGCGGFVLIDE